jgi:hypothetical protein
MDQEPVLTGDDFDDHPVFNAIARMNDPETSWAAANSIMPEKMRETYKLILEAIGEHGPLADKEIPQFIPAGTQSPSGLRTRRDELVKRGLLEFAGYTKKVEGSKLQHRVWTLTMLGAELFSDMTGAMPLVPPKERKC